MWLWLWYWFVTEGGQSKKSKQVASANTPTNGSGRKSKGAKEVKNIID